MLVAAQKQRIVGLPEMHVAEYSSLAELGAADAFERPTEETLEVGLAFLLDGIERRFG